MTMSMPDKSFVKNFKSDYTVDGYLKYNNDSGDLLIKKGLFSFWRLTNVNLFQDYEIIYDADNQSELSLSRAVLGGMIAGGIGSILLGQKSVTYLNKLIVRVDFKNEFYFDFKIITSKIKINSFSFNRAMREVEEISKFFAIVQENKAKGII